MMISFGIQIFAYALICISPTNLPLVYTALVITMVVMYFTNVDKAIEKVKNNR